MAVNTSTCCAPPLHHSMPPRLPRSFFPQTSSRLCFPGDLWIPRLTSVCSHLSGSDGLVSKRSVRPQKERGGSVMELRGPESIADHMYCMVLMALIAEDIPEHGKIVDEFCLSTAGKFQTDAGKSWAAAEIISKRKLTLRKRHNYLEEN